MKLDEFKLISIKWLKFCQTFLGFYINYVKEHKNVYFDKDGTVFLMYGRDVFFANDK